MLNKICIWDTQNSKTVFILGASEVYKEAGPIMVTAAFQMLVPLTACR